MALVVGTTASLAANIAVGGADPIGKALAGWPALSMLVSVTLLFALPDHESVDQRTTGPDDQRMRRDDTAISGIVAAARTNTAVPDRLDRPADRSHAGHTGQRGSGPHE